MSSTTVAVQPNQAACSNVPRCFVKTRFCHFFEQNRCLRGSNCTFAHARSELKPLPDLSRIRLCPEWTRWHSCSKQGCTFAHGEEDLRSRGRRRGSTSEPTSPSSVKATVWPVRKAGLLSQADLERPRSVSPKYVASPKGSTGASFSESESELSRALHRKAPEDSRRNLSILSFLQRPGLVVPNKAEQSHTDEDPIRHQSSESPMSPTSTTGSQRRKWADLEMDEVDDLWDIPTQRSDSNKLYDEMEAQSSTLTDFAMTATFSRRSHGSIGGHSRLSWADLVENDEDSEA